MPHACLTLAPCPVLLPSLQDTDVPEEVEEIVEKMDKQVGLLGILLKGQTGWFVGYITKGQPGGCFEYVTKGQAGGLIGCVEKESWVKVDKRASSSTDV